MKYSKGIMWLDDCRIPFVDENINFDRPRLREKNQEWILTGGFTFENADVKEYNQQGRFTPNLLVCDDMLNDGSVSNSSGGIPNGKSVYGRTSYNESSTINTQTKVGFGDKGTNSRYYDLDKWFDKIVDNL